MARINILTVINEPNYGACLQGYALYETLRRLGHEPRMINLSLDFRRRPFTLLNRILISLNNRRKGYDHCYRRAKKFTSMFMPDQTQEFHSIDELKNYDWAPDEYYIVGSDQVWNPAITGILAKAYTLDFLPEQCKLRYCYASSFGTVRDEERLLGQLDIDSFRKFRKLGVREKSGCDFLASHGIESCNVIDPTLLLSDYHSLSGRAVTPKKEILFISLSDTAAQQKFVGDVSRRYSLPVHKIYGYLQPSRSDNLKFLSVTGWLDAIAGAELVLSDSFHATVFAILFHRQFYVYLSAPGKADRIVSLLDRLGISRTRIVADAKDIDPNDRIDYSKIDEKLMALRDDSLKFLNSFFD